LLLLALFVVKLIFNSVLHYWSTARARATWSKR